MKKLTQFLTNQTLFEAVLPNVNELMSLLEKKKASGQTISLFYGETYDQFGITIDSLKYYFILSLIHFYLKEYGYKVQSTVIQADIASLINKSAQKKQKQLARQKSQRLKILKKIINTYHLPIEIKLMSDIFKTPQYQKNISLVTNFANLQTQNSHFFTNLEKTVLKNRLRQEKQNKFKYALEAIATAMLFDIKIGPPREQFYDQAQRLMAQELNLDRINCIYLKPTYPLAQNFSFFLSHPEIEEFGLTPYKAGSNKMNDYRIILGETNHKQLEKLINDSFESSNPEVAHPVLEMLIIADLAERLMNKNQALPHYEQTNLLNNTDALKKKTIAKTSNYILRRFKNEK